VTGLLNERAAGQFLKVLLEIVIALAVVNIGNFVIGNEAWHITSLISLGGMRNFATWFSSMLFAVAAVLAFFVPLRVSAARKERRIWQACSWVLLVMSCNKVARLHESLVHFLNKYVYRWHLVDWTAWLTTLGAVALLGIFLFLAFSRRRLGGAARAGHTVFSGMSFAALGALALKSVWRFCPGKGYAFVLSPECILEKVLEMLAAIIIIGGVLEIHRGGEGTGF